ncbi:hypothetical protein [Desertivirga arenae]|uniref:hypothetical protein n=1 Tax=Desertivirga arenae TaxID=2810309 RepID=UPI001A9625E4|nr:hypothetical protein [Pedobacter sp. SYSU D00823]
MKNLTWILVVFLFFLVLACSKENVEEAHFDKRKYNYDLIIEGGINTMQRQQYIRLNKPSFNADSLPKAIDDAVVLVNDGQKDIPFKITSTPGVYSGNIIQNQRYNQAYKLIVRYNGKEYTAIDSLIQVVNIIDDFIPLSILRYPDKSLELNIPKHTFGFNSSAKWFIAYKNPGLWNASKFDSLSYSYTHSFGAPNSIYPLLNQKRQEKIGLDDFVTLYKFSLSSGYSKYLYSVFLETDWRGIFSSAPGVIKGNVSNGALGYFYVTDVDVRRYKVSELIQ